MMVSSSSTEAGTRSPARSGRPSAWVWIGPVVAILALQTMAAFLSRFVPTVGPVLTSEFGWAESWIGYLAAATMVGSLMVLLVGAPIVRRVGSVRTLQISLLIGAASLALLAWPALLAPFVASLAIGLSYGVATPAGSEVLQRFTPPGRRNLVFSIKQAGVPLGGVLAGTLLPPMVEALGWRVALAATGALVVICALAVQPLQRRADHLESEDESRRRPLFAGGLTRTLLRPLMSLTSAPGIMRISIAGALLVASQSCWLAFTVTYLVVDIGVSLTAAGVIFAVMQTTSVIGRIGFGWLSDRTGSGVLTMQVCAVAAAAATALLGFITPAWPLWSLLLLAGCGGLAVSGWNGVQIAEIAQRSPLALVGETAAGSTILIFMCNIVAPALFTLFVSMTGRFDIGFLAVAAVTLLSLAFLAGLRVDHAQADSG